MTDMIAGLTAIRQQLVDLQERYEAHLREQADRHSTDMVELVDFVEYIANMGTGKIRSEANKLLAKHGRPGVPLGK